jgi:hypothetical protein
MCVLAALPEPDDSSAQHIKVWDAREHGKVDLQGWPLPHRWALHRGAEGVLVDDDRVTDESHAYGPLKAMDEAFALVVGIVEAETAALVEAIPEVPRLISPKC